MTSFPFLPRLRRFRDAEDGVMAVEAVVVIPFLVWSFLALFALTDVYRSQHANTTSSYTIVDALSRETEAVNAAYIEGLNNLHTQMTRARAATKMRATHVWFDGGDNQLEVRWSYGTGELPALTTATLSEISARIPTLSNGESVIVVETWMPYSPIVDYLVEDLNIYKLVVSRPRYAPTIAWAN